MHHRHAWPTPRDFQVVLALRAMPSLWLHVVETPDKSAQGTRVELQAGTYRVVARVQAAHDETQQLTQDGDRALDPDRQQIVNRVVGASAPTRVGRGAHKRAPDLGLMDDGVSRTHAMVFRDEQGHVSVVDLMSTNGTSVNGQQVQDADLRAGDVVRVGGTRLQVLVE